MIARVFSLLLVAGFLGCSGAGVPGRSFAPDASAAEDQEAAPDSFFGLSTLRGADELLILERSQAAGDDFYLGRGFSGELNDAPTQRQRLRDQPSSGSLITELEDRIVVIPLAHTAVTGEVRGNVASLAVTQQFQNPFDHPIEAVYVFPLPHNAAVTDFLMTIGERTIRGVIRERKEAEELYAAAKRQGITASLLTQQRPNIFTQKVANIAPGGAIDVSVEYFNQLRYLDGWYELVFPMVVGPRYNPAGTQDGIGAVTLASRGASGQLVEVPYLRPGERSGHEVSFELDLHAGAPIEELSCSTHQLEIERPSADRAHISLPEFDRIPNKDLVLRYRVAAETVRTSLHVVQTEDQGWLHLTILPQALLRDLPAQAMELICVVDTSGSMEGAPLRQAKAAIHDALDRLTPADSFRVIRFSNGARELEYDPLIATPGNLERGHAYVDRLRASGGTEMMTGLRACLRHDGDPARQRLVVFLTDGHIGNEEQVLGEVRRSVGDARIFSFGVGSSTNRFLLEAMAREGRGAATFLGLEDDAQPVMARTFERLRRPALTDLSIDWGGLPVTGVFPTELPDLFVGRPLELVARLSEPVDTSRAVVRVLGSVAGDQRDLPVRLQRVGPGPGGRALSKLWARAKIADLHSQARAQDAQQPESYERRIREVALEYGLLSAYTAFLAIDSMTRVEGEAETVPVTVPVTVPLPEGVEFDTTLGQGADRSGG